MDISVVIPLYNEAESLPELFAWIERVMKEHNFSYEVIFINDGSTDNSWEVIEALKSKNPEVVHAVKFRRNYGKSPGLNCGFQRAKGDVVITMDADLQDSPDEIPELYRMITEEGYDLVSGWKKKRYESLACFGSIIVHLIGAVFSSSCRISSKVSVVKVAEYL